MRRQFLFFSMLSVMGGIAHAQSIYTYVQQNGEKLGQLGTASFEVNAGSNPTVEFVDGKAVMTIGDNKVASLPMSHGGELVVEWTTTLGESELNRVTKSPTDVRPFATIYSPFQLVVPEGSDVYAPSFDPNSNLLYLGNKLEAGAIVPPETALTLHGTSTVNFAFSAAAATCSPKSALSGTALKIDVPAGETVYTYGIGKTGPQKGKFGLFRYTGTTLGAGLCWLQTDKTQGASYIGLMFDSLPTGMDGVERALYAGRTVKVVENGRVMIKTANRKYNINGQEEK